MNVIRIEMLSALIVLITQPLEAATANRKGADALTSGWIREDDRLSKALDCTTLGGVVYGVISNSGARAAFTKFDMTVFDDMNDDMRQQNLSSWNNKTARIAREIYPNLDQQRWAGLRQESEDRFWRVSKSKGSYKGVGFATFACSNWMSRI
jgi:hypothetical protein